MDRAREFDQLRGQQITSWSGVEMALREEAASGGGPQFEDSAVACLQMLVLCATRSGATVVFIDTYQNCDGWGLRLGQRRIHDSREWNGIYRLRALPELPTGEVDDVSIMVDDNILAEVVLTIDGRPLLLMAGEVHESAEDRLELVRLDESVLVFTDPSAAESWTGFAIGGGQYSADGAAIFGRDLLAAGRLERRRTGAFLHRSGLPG